MPGRRGLAALGGIALGAAAFGGSAQAATLTVTNLNDSGAGSLRDALSQAGMTAEPDTVTFASGLSGTINLSSTLFAGPYAVAIQGPGAGQLTISGDGAHPVLEVGFAGLTRREFAISGVTITGGGGLPSAGVFDVDANLTISNSVITGNNTTAAGSSTYHGAGIASASSSASVPQNLTIDHSRITNNTLSNSGTGARYGAGISAKYTNVAITDSTVSGNQLVHSPSSTGFGGGISVLHGSLQLSRSALSGNSSDTGGGLYSKSSTGDTQISNSTIANNHAGNGAGILWAGNNDPQTLTVTGTTISKNQASIMGGIADQSQAHGVLRNSIVSGNVVTLPNGDPDVYSSGGSGFDTAFSLVGNPQGANVYNTVPGSNIIGQDPQLGPLADNGGPVQTMALASSSPAVDKGAAFGLTADARGVLRPIDFPDIPNSPGAGADGADIGAFELQPSNALTLGKLKKNKKKGTAVQTVNLPVPDAGTVTLSGKRLKTQTKSALATGVLKLKLIAKGKAKKALRRKGKAKVTATVTYNPTGQTPNTLTKKVKLRKRLKRR